MEEAVENKLKLSITTDGAEYKSNKENVFYQFAKILVVDDEQIIRNLMGKMLSLFGYGTVVLAEGGEKALQIILEAINENKPFDLVITDFSMGQEGNGGLALCKAINYLEEPAKPVVIVCTALLNNKLTVDSLSKAGVSCFLPKPFNIEQLEELLGDALNSHAELRSQAWL